MCLTVQGAEAEAEVEESQFPTLKAVVERLERIYQGICSHPCHSLNISNAGCQNNG